MGIRIGIGAQTRLMIGIREDYKATLLTRKRSHVENKASWMKIAFVFKCF